MQRRLPGWIALAALAAAGSGAVRAADDSSAAGGARQPCDAMEKVQ